MVAALRRSIPGARVGAAMRHFAATLPLALVLVAGCSADPAPSCTPACRSGFVCVSGACVSACNPPCRAGERCTDEAACVPDVDAGIDAGSTIDAAASDAGVIDASADGAVTDDAAGGGDAATVGDGGARDGGAPTSCPEGEVLCGGACRAPMLPEVGTRRAANGRWMMDWLGEADVAIDPCTGNMGVAWAQMVAGGDNYEIYVSVVPASATAPATAPVRVTTAPGMAASPAVSWAGDRFGVFWSDPRHDPLPEACEPRCLSELYYAAFDPTSGALVVPEQRLTTHASGYRAHSARATWGPSAGAMAVAWVDGLGDREVHAAIVRADGTLAWTDVVSAAAPTWGATPQVVWSEGVWHLLYRHDDTDGARPDYVHVRTLDADGTLGVDRDTMLSAEQIGFTPRGPLGFATITTGHTPLALRLWSPTWTATTTLAVTYGTFDGSWGLSWDGASLYVTHAGGAAFELVRLNGLGTETGRVTITSSADERNPGSIRLHRVGTRLVLLWRWGTGGVSPTVHHTVHVLDTSSFP